MTTANPSPCPITDTELLAYRDDELALTRRAVLSDHIAKCSSCQLRLSQAELVTGALTLGSPLRDQPAARVAIHQRIAGERDGWWRRRMLVGAALPAALLLLVVIGFNRWQREEDCASCPPPPAPMLVTAFSGLPAGWASLLPCQPEPATSQVRTRANQTLAQAGPPRASRPGARAQQSARPPTRTNRNQGGPPSLAIRQSARGDAMCATTNLVSQPGLNVGPELGVIGPTNRRGT